MLGLLTVLLWLGYVVDGSHALFQDQVRLTNNSIVTGSTDLLISNSQNPSSTVYETERAGFTFPLSPGQSASKYFLVKKSSDANVDMELEFSTFISSEHPNPLANATILHLSEVDETGTILPLGERFSGTVSELEETHRLTTFVVPKGQARRFQLTAELAASYIQQGNELVFDLVVDGVQVL
jgi:hypothetical protein